jgi:hypothetical protein
MENVTSKAKSTAKCIVGVPQKIGHSILTVPDKIFNKEPKGEEKEERDEAAEDLHAKICTNIIDDQNGRIAVRESQEQCMREITEHLKLHIFTITGSSPNGVDRYEYTDWIEALHPDNVNYIGSGRSIIDHRFYMKDSHHRNLWNEYMIKLDCKDSIVMEESRDPSNHTNEEFADTLVKWPNECFGTIGDSCGLFP